MTGAVGGDRYFHGGVPGLAVGDTLVPADELGISVRYASRYLVPADELGISVRYASRYAVHDPAWVYVTTDEAVAFAYASRCQLRDGRAVPGDVYQVQPVGPLREDPDYGGHFPGTFLRCRRARILRRAAEAVALSEREQRERERRYRVWERADEPIWDEHGVINPSRQMRGNGVTREWTGMLRPWLGPEDVGSSGRLLVALRAAGDDAGADELWDTVLEVVPALDRDCRIRAGHRPAHGLAYWCEPCGRRLYGRDHAAVHQPGERAVDLLLAVHRWDDPQVRPTVLGLLVRAAIRRSPPRWQWLHQDVTELPVPEQS